MNKSKPLLSSDDSADEFVRECLKGDPTYGINFDRIQTNSQTGKYLILEYLLCDERQFKNKVTPFSSRCIIEGFLQICPPKTVTY